MAATERDLEGIAKDFLTLLITTYGQESIEQIITATRAGVVGLVDATLFAQAVLREVEGVLGADVIDDIVTAARRIAVQQADALEDAKFGEEKPKGETP